MLLPPPEGTREEKAPFSLSGPILSVVVGGDNVGPELLSNVCLQRGRFSWPRRLSSFATGNVVFEVDNPIVLAPRRKKGGCLKYEIMQKMVAEFFFFFAKYASEPDYTPSHNCLW